MSTPATLPAQHGYHGYSHHGNYTSKPGYQSPSDPATARGPPMAPTSSYSNYTLTASQNPTNPSKQLPPLNAVAPTPSSLMSSKPSNQHRPDWNEFYKNGPPKEIIVIDDDSPPPQPSQPSQAVQKAPIKREYMASRNAKQELVEHTNKKRRTGHIYDNVPSHHQPSYSHDNTRQSGSDTISTDRTTSLHNTAPTSLGSNGSGSGGGYIEPASIGQKRKRAVRQIAEDKKRKEIATAAGDLPYSSYIPPPRPPIKAKEVQVVAIKDSQPNHSKCDDEDGHFIVQENSEMADRYQIKRLLGQGTFGKVVEAYDKRKKTRCAIKIIRSVQKYRDASRIELRVLSTLAQNDAENRNKCIHLRDCFDYRNHICIVTDLLGQSVFDFLKGNSFVPFPSSQIQSFARQLLTSVAFLHDLDLIHTDLKPENILLVNNHYQTFTYNKVIPTSSTQSQRRATQRRVLLDTEIRLIDFGSATFNDEYHSSVVSTRHYRAPEIILNLGWSYPCDIWSIGCILVEFYTGDALFQTHDNLEHLAMMEVVCDSKIDPKLIKAVQAMGRNTQAAKFFRGTKLDYPTKDTGKASKKYVGAMKRLEEIIPPSTKFNQQFLDLLRKIFVYTPSHRMSAKEALKHSWFKESIIDDGTEAARIRKEREEANGSR